MMGRLALLVLVGIAVGSTGHAARITVTASKVDTLYAQISTPTCSDWSKTADDQLPSHVVRLRVTPPSGIALDQLRFEWQPPSPSAGMFAADEDLGANEQTSIIRTLCADVGNECSLTDEQLVVYNRPTILWVAPTCDVLPDDTTKPFRGDRVRFSVRVFRGRRRLGKGVATVGYGRIGSLTLLVSDNPSKQPFRNGLGKPGGEKIFINPVFGALLDAGGANLPSVVGYKFDSGGGGVANGTTPCSLAAGLSSCTQPGEILYTAGGKAIASLAADLNDGSALCDKLTVDVRTTTIIPKLEVTTSPARQSFRSGDSVTLRVRLHNASPPGSGGNILITGTAATCQTKVKVGGSVLSKTSQIDLQHCSATVGQPCDTDKDCATQNCDQCEAGETCLTSDHCSTRTSPPDQVIGCATDRDCQPPRCPICDAGDTCIQLLPERSIFPGVGDQVDLVDSVVQVDNMLPSTAKVTDTWTAHTFNAGDDTDVIKYSIGPKR